MRILYIAPHENIERLAGEIWPQFKEFYLQNNAHEATVLSQVDFRTVTIHYNEDLLSPCQDADIVICRGSQSVYIRQAAPQKYVINTPITTGNIIDALDRVIKRKKVTKAAIIGTANMLEMVELLPAKYKELLVPYYFKREDVENVALVTLLHEVAARNYDAILGGVTTCTICEMLGCDHERLESSKEAIWYALTQAVYAITVVQKERDAAVLHRGIVEYSQEGVIAIDRENRVALINHAAEHLLNVSASTVVGVPVKVAFSSPALQKAFCTDGNLKNVVVPCGNFTININKAYLTDHNQNLGSIITFKDITSILEVESMIRAQVRKKGLIARYTFSDIIGASPAIERTKKLARIFAGVDSNVFLDGESGTGKEVFAQSIHNASNRKNGPFVAINCAALPESLLESELFGYAPGAFTGASSRGKRGFFELAHHGTLFLDEVGDLPLNLQGRLLRVLQEKSVMRIGDDHIIPVDVRIICASNKELESLVTQGSFREDLFYRLKVLSLTIPPLRKRGRDVLDLMNHYLRYFSIKNGKPQQRLDSETEDTLLAYQWKGNVRELRNICEYLSVVADALITTESLPPQVVTEAVPVPSDKPPVAESARPHSHGGELDMPRILEALHVANHNKAKAARILGISRTTLWRKLRQAKAPEMGTGGQ